MTLIAQLHRVKNVAAALIIIATIYVIWQDNFGRRTTIAGAIYFPPKVSPTNSFRSFYLWGAVIWPLAALVALSMFDFNLRECGFYEGYL